MYRRFPKYEFWMVSIDSKLAFKSYIYNCANRARQRLSMMSRVTRKVDKSGLATIYKGFVRCVMESGSTIWAGKQIQTSSSLTEFSIQQRVCLGRACLATVYLTLEKLAAFTICWSVAMSSPAYRLSYLLWEYVGAQVTVQDSRHVEAVPSFLFAEHPIPEVSESRETVVSKCFYWRLEIIAWVCVSFIECFVDRLYEIVVPIYWAVWV